MKRIAVMFVLLFSTGAVAAFCESLWVPSFKGYLSDSTSVEVGDIILVNVDSQTTLTYLSSRVDSEQVVVELSGGDGIDLLSFLPTGSASGNQSLRGREEISLEVSLAARALDVDDAGMLFVRGGRTLEVQGKVEEIILSGWLDPEDLDDQRSIPLSGLLDGRLIYRTFLTTGDPVISPEDLRTVFPETAPQLQPEPDAEEITPVVEPAAADEVTDTAAIDEVTETTAPVTTEAPGEGGTTPTTTATTPQTPTTVLSEDKKRELLLIYINRLLDLIFQQ